MMIENESVRSGPTGPWSGTTTATLGEVSQRRASVQHAKALDAETRAGQWLADGNEARDAGKLEKAERCYAKAQYWLDRYNKLAGRA